MEFQYVSTFELLLKRQAPEPFPGERVVQGYFLNITNLEDRAYSFDVRFVQATPQFDTANRELLDNNITLVDSPSLGEENQGGQYIPSILTNTYVLSTKSIKIPSQGTAKLAVLPKIPTDDKGKLDLGGANLEIRGYVEIIALVPLLFPLQRSVDVLLTPQNRATFFNEDDQITNQLQSSLPTGDGGTFQKIPTKIQPLIFKNNLITQIDRSDILEILDKIPEKDKNEMLASLLESADPNATQA